MRFFQLVADNGEDCSWFELEMSRRLPSTSRSLRGTTTSQHARGLPLTSCPQPRPGDFLRGLGLEVVLAVAVARVRAKGISFVVEAS